MQIRNVISGFIFCGRAWKCCRDSRQKVTSMYATCYNGHRICKGSKPSINTRFFILYKRWYRVREMKLEKF